MRYYDLDAANARLITVRPLLRALRSDRDEVAREQKELGRLADAGGDASAIAERDQREAAVRDAVGRMKHIVVQLVEWDVTLRDIGTGLIDLPALANGLPVWLCWKLGEGDIGWWHGMDEGFAARRPITDLPTAGPGLLS